MMFGWFSRKKENKTLENLVKILSKGITVNVNVNVSGINSGSGTSNEQERGNTLEKGAEPEVYTFQNETRENKERTPWAEQDSTIPNLSKLKKPKVNFGEETEV